jgi:hypothetical protein
MSHRRVGWCLHVQYRSQEVDATKYPRVPKAEINGIYGNVAKTFYHRMLGEVPLPIAAPVSRTRIAYDPVRRNP